MKKKHIIIISVTVVVILVILASIFKGGKKEVDVVTQKVERRDITEIVTVTGQMLVAK